MATSETEIVNLALLRLAEDRIASIDAGGKVANAVKLAYVPVRDSLLRRYRWNFAIERQNLAPEGTAPAFGFTNRFMLPANCLKLLGIFDQNELQQNYTSSKIPHKVEGRFVLCDESALPVFYIKAITNVTLFDPMFTEALWLKIAAAVGFDLSITSKLVAAINEEFKDIIKQAKLADAIEGSPEIIEASTWFDSRTALTPPRIGPVVGF